VGPDVAARFQTLFPERTDLDRQTKLDLPEANRRQLLSAGIPAVRISSGAPCTFCAPDDFHSYRRTPADTGRMLSVIGIRP
jgi:copper oxidase (laccase) domain-containing protein